MANAAATDLSQLHNDLVSGGIALQAGQSLAVTGLSSAFDSQQNFTITTQYAGGDANPVANSYQDFILTGIATVELYIFSSPTGGQLQLKGSLDGTNFTGTLEGIPQRVNSQTANGAPTTGFSLGTTVYRFNTSGFQKVRVFSNVQGTGTWTGVLRGHANPTVVSIGDPVNTESVRDTFSYSALNFAPATTATDVVAITNSAQLRVCEIDLKGTATAGAWVNYRIIKSTATNTGGTTVNMDGSSHYDSGDLFTAFSGTAVVYSANPTTTPGTRRIIYQGTLYVPPVGTPAFNPGEKLRFGETHSKELMIRQGEQFSIDLMGATLPAGLTLTANIRVTVHS